MSKNLKGCFSHKSDDWSTPKTLYDQMIFEEYFDPCPLHSDFDGLSIQWPAKVFVNPPYSNIKSFVEKAIFELKSHHSFDVVFLVPVRTDTIWFLKMFPFIHHIDFICGRLHFGNSKLGALFPSMLVHLRPLANVFIHEFNVVGREFYE